MSESVRETLEKMGPEKVRHLLSQGMLVHHLCVPAHQWLDELATAEKRAKEIPIDEAAG